MCSFFPNYKFIWIVEDDAHLTFNPLHYECVVKNFSIPLSAPSRGEGAAIHPITKTKSEFIETIGRYTDFVEIGPTVIGTSQAWLCIWKFINIHAHTGYGLDGMWCRLISERCMVSKYGCAILDAFITHHESERYVSGHEGIPEIPSYAKIYKKDYETGMRTFAPIAKDLRVYNDCLEATEKI